MAVFLVLPACNEAPNLPGLFDEVAALNRAGTDCRVVLVDDGSSDGTAGVAAASAGPLKVFVERHPRNLGLGAALRTGLTRALTLAGEGDRIAVMDADLSHPPALLAAMESKISQGFDAVVASRYAAGGREVGLTLKRKALSRLCNFWLRRVFAVPGVKDYTCGYRLFRSAPLRELQAATSGRFFEEGGFVCTSELLVNLARGGARFAEVPLVLRYDRKRGESKMRVWKTVAGYFRLARRG